MSKKLACSRSKTIRLDSFASHGFIPLFQHQPLLAVMRLRRALISNRVIRSICSQESAFGPCGFNFCRKKSQIQQNTLTKNLLLQPMECDFIWWQMVAANCIYSF